MTALSLLPRCAAAAAHCSPRLLAIAAAVVVLPAVAQTPSVVVTGTRFAEAADALPFGATVITAQELRRAGVTSVNEALMRLAGVPGRLDLTGGGEYTLDLRGFGSTADVNQVVVVDGQRISEADLSGTRLSGIAIDSIERIEILRGSGAVLYGEGATAGVIVITTKSGAARSGGSVVATGGSDGLRELRADGTLVSGGLTLDAAASRRLGDGHRENAAYDSSAATLGLKWQHDGLSLAVRHADDRLDSGLPGSLTADQFATDPWQASTPGDRASLHNQRTTLQAALALTGGWSLALDGGWRDKASRSIYASYGGTYDYDVDASQWSVRARHVGRFDLGSNTFAFGVDDNRWEREVLGAFGSMADQTNRGVFVRDELVLSGGTRLVAGYRREALRKSVSTAFSADTLDRDLDAWELAVLQPLSAQWQAYARLGRSFRLASVDEFSFTSPGTVLRPQTSQDAELGLRWRQGGSTAELRLFRNALTDEIGYDPAAAGPFGPGANVNYDRTQRQGLEFEGQHALSSAWTLRAAAAWRQSRFVAGPYDGNNIPLAVPRNASIGVGWQPAQGHTLDAWLRASAAQPVNFANSCRLPGAATVDARYAWRLQPVELSLAVGNLFDHQYATQAFACTADGRASSIYPEPGRTVSASARWFF